MQLCGSDGGTLDFRDELRHRCDPGRGLGLTKLKLDLLRGPRCHWKSQLVRASGAMQRHPDWAGWRGCTPPSSSLPVQCNSPSETFFFLFSNL